MQRTAFDDQLHIATHPIRRQLLQNLEHEKSYASKLATKLSLNPKIVQFHLGILERYHLVEAKFGLQSGSDSRPVAVKYYTPTKDGRYLTGYISDVARKIARQ